MKRRWHFRYKTLGLSLIISVLLSASHTLASSCCIGGHGAEAWILGDERGLLQVSWRGALIVMDAMPDGSVILRDPETYDAEQTLTVASAYAFSDRWQVMVSLPIRAHHYVTPEGRDSTMGLGDPSLGLGVQALKPLRYSPWKPDILITAGFQIPLGVSPYETQLPQQALSSGFFRPSLGVWISKTWNAVDLRIRLSGDLPVSRSVVSQDVGENLTLYPTPGFVGFATLGYRFESVPLRLGLGLGPSYQGAIDVDAASPRSLPARRLWNLTLEVAYALSETLSASLSYTDQTLLGPAYATELQRSLMFVLQRSWLR